MDLLLYDVIVVICLFIIFFTLLFVMRYILKNFGVNSRFLDLKEYFPEEEIHTLKQVFYLVMMFLCFIICLYSIISNNNEVLIFTIIDIILCLYLATKSDWISLRNKVLLTFLVPVTSLFYIIHFIFHIPFYFSDLSNAILLILDICHILILIYFIKVYFEKFIQYTTNNSLGISILLLYVIIAVSFFITVVSENVTPLDSINMVSNAFTSNGYTVLGSSTIGKLNSIILVWGGYILSGVGTATLTAAILTRQFNKRFEKLEELIKKNDND